MAEPNAPRWTALLIVFLGVLLVIEGWIARPLLLGVIFIFGLPTIALGVYWWRQR